MLCHFSTAVINTWNGSKSDRCSIDSKSMGSWFWRKHEPDTSIYYWSSWAGSNLPYRSWIGNMVSNSLDWLETFRDVMMTMDTMLKSWALHDFMTKYFPWITQFKSDIFVDFASRFLYLKHWLIEILNFDFSGYSCEDHFYEPDTFLHSWEVLLCLMTSPLW